MRPPTDAAAHLCAHRPQAVHLLLAHLVRHDHAQPVAAAAGHQREREAGVAGRGLEDAAAGAEAPVGLGGGDHGERDAVLDAAAGVLVLELEEELAGAGVEGGDLKWGWGEEGERSGFEFALCGRAQVQQTTRVRAFERARPARPMRASD
jgi:hypothetical protein